MKSQNMTVGLALLVLLPLTANTASAEATTVPCFEKWRSEASKQECLAEWKRVVEDWPVSGAELLVNLKDYAGHKIKLRHADVVAADNGGAFVKAQGAQLRISWKNADRDTMRMMLENCGPLIAEAYPCKDVDLKVRPTGEQIEGLPGFGPYPILTDVELAE